MISVVRTNTWFSRGGFTLLEVMISATILVLVVAGTFAMFTAGERFVREALHRRQAMEYGQAVLEMLHDEVKWSTWESGDLSDPLSPGTHTDSENPFLTLPAGDFRDVWDGSRQYVVEDLDWDGDPSTAEAKRVTVTVSWDEPRLQ